MAVLIDRGRIAELLAAGWEYYGEPKGDDVEWSVLMTPPSGYLAEEEARYRDEDMDAAA